MEIECDNEKIIKDVASKLNLNFSDGKYGAFDQQYLDYDGIPKDVVNNVISCLTFENMESDLKPFIERNFEMLNDIKSQQIKKYKIALDRNKKHINKTIN